MVELVGGIGLYVVSGLTLWLLLARRKRVAARCLFVGYLAGSMLLQSLLFDPVDRTASRQRRRPPLRLGSRSASERRPRR